MLGRDDEYVGGLERAMARSRCGDVPRAVRCAFWIGHSLLFRGEKARRAGWFARAQRLLGGDGPGLRRARLPPDPASGWSRWRSGDFEAGYATAAEAAEIGERFGDADLVWLARDDRRALW